eukprot:5458335-Amphidinium_carterae.1
MYSSEGEQQATPRAEFTSEASVGCSERHRLSSYVVAPLVPEGLARATTAPGRPPQEEALKAVFRKS